MEQARWVARLRCGHATGGDGDIPAENWVLWCPSCQEERPVEDVVDARPERDVGGKAW